MARHGTRLLSREGETGDQSCVVPNIVHSPVPSTLSRPSMRGSFYSLSVASLAGVLWKLRLTRGRRPGGASATAAPAPRHALSGPGERGDSDTCGRWTSPSTLDSSMSANTLQLKWTER